MSEAVARPILSLDLHTPPLRNLNVSRASTFEWLFMILGGLPLYLPFIGVCVAMERKTGKFMLSLPPFPLLMARRLPVVLAA